jgi:hypothetical protein
MAAIARIGGVALKPGVSRNKRLYTTQEIAGMVAAAQQQIASPDGMALTMLTHHLADDDSTRIVGRVTQMSLDKDGNARYEAEVAGTQHGRTIADLIEPGKDGRPGFLQGVSIRAARSGARVRQMADGTAVETGDELRLAGLDFTHKPGVLGAGIDTFAWTDGGTKTETSERVLVTESVEEALVAPVTEETSPSGGSAIPAAFRAVVPEPPHVLRDGSCVTCPAEATEAATPTSKRTDAKGPGGPFADIGYQKDGKPRYQLDTKAHAKAAWSYINQADNAKTYTANQLKRIKARIKAALGKFGVSVATESAGWSFDTAVPVGEAVSECYGGMGCDPEQSGSYSVSATNGPTNISICSYRLDPAELQVILRAAVEAACAALKELDPDMDGDIDVDGAPNADTDDSESDEDEPTEETGTEPAASPEAPAEASPAAGTQENKEGSVMPETNEAAGQTTAAPSFTQADVDAAIARGIQAAEDARRARKAARRGTQAPAESAPAAPVAESAPVTPAAPAAPVAPAAAVSESEDDKIARLVTAALAEKFGTNESADERIARLVQEGVDAATAAMVQSGQVNLGRKGIVKPATESTPAAGGTGLTSFGVPSDWPQKPLHEYSPDELEQYTNPILVGRFLGNKADYIQ